MTITESRPIIEAVVTRLVVGWAATDANAHMRSTAYLDAANDSFMQHCVSHGWPLERFHAIRIGPVLLGHEITYRRELRLGEAALVDLTLSDLGPGGVRFQFRNTVRRESDGALAATITSSCAWVDLDHRRLVAPPAEFLEVLAALPAS